MNAVESPQPDIAGYRPNGKPITQTDVDDMTPWAIALVQVNGPALSAGDDGTVALAYAAANATLLGPGWCECDQGAVPNREECYFRRPNGSHGWFCSVCRKITQLG